MVEVDPKFPGPRLPPQGDGSRHLRKDEKKFFKEMIDVCGEMERLQKIHEVANKEVWKAKARCGKNFQKTYDEALEKHRADFDPFMVANEKARAEYKAKFLEIDERRRVWKAEGGLFGESPGNFLGKIPLPKKRVGT